MNARQPIGAAIVAVALAAVAGAGPASAQSNLDAGKSPARLFAQGCSACHGAPHELAVVRRDFLIQHYTTGPEQADLLAAYLEAVRNEPGRTPKPRRSPRAETDVADVVSTGSIGVTPPAATEFGTAELSPASSEAPAMEGAAPEPLKGEAAPPRSQAETGE